MLNISQTILAGVFFLSWIAFWVFVIYAVITFLHRLSEISQALQSIDAKLSVRERHDLPAPHEQA